MAADKILKIALMLTAVDQMSQVVGSATNSALGNIDKLKEGYKDVIEGVAGMMAGKALYDKTVAPIKDAFEQVQDAGTEMRIAMMREGGKFDDKLFSKVEKSTVAMSEKFGIAQEQYMDMYRMFKSNHVAEGDVLGGLGDKMGMFSRLMKVDPTEGTKFIAGLKNDLYLSNEELVRMMDLAQRLHFDEGVGKTGADAVQQLTEAFSQASMGMNNLHYNGIEAATEFTAVMAPFLRRNMSPEQIGTGFRKIFENLDSIEKRKKFDAGAAKYGLKFDFFDDKGNFKGIANFMGQMDLMKGMYMPQIDDIMQPLTGGKSGAFGSMAKILAQTGSAGYEAGMKHTFSGAQLLDRYTQAMKNLSVQEDINSQKWHNAAVQLGNLLLPAMTRVINAISKFVSGLQHFISAHPIIAKTIMYLLAATSAMLVLGGALKIGQGVMLLAGGGFGMLIKVVAGLAAIGEVLVLVIYNIGVALLTTPLGWLILAIAAVILVIKNWGAIWTWLKKEWVALGAFFSMLWDKVKTAFHSAISFIGKLLMLSFMPFVLIYKHWNGIKEWFHKMWEKVKGVFVAHIKWLFSLGVKFFEAGANIVRSIANGIKKMIKMPVELIKGMVGKIRNLLPFSPAKEGPLRDIHKIRLIETIAESIKPAALMDKMRSVVGAVFNYHPAGQIRGIGAGGNTICVTYAPVYNAKGGSYATERNAWLEDARRNKTELMSIINEQLVRQASKTYG